MLNTVVFDNEIKIWWEYVRLNKGERFAVYKGEEAYFTTDSHFNFKNLIPETAYSCKVSVEDEQGRTVKELGEICVTTKKTKSKIDVTKAPYNAVGDGITVNTVAIQNAINDCGENECVYLPKGTFLTGALNLKSNMELYLEDDATLLGTTEPADYLPKIKSRFEGWEMMCYRSLLNVGEMDHSKGYDTENIVIRGGKILGGGNELREKIIDVEREGILKHCGMENEDSPHAIYSTIIPGRTRGRAICCCNTKNVIIANTFAGNSPAWNLHFIYCENVIVCGCTVYSKKVTNGDGINPDSTKNCTIFDNCFDTGDDCVAIKSGKNPEGYFIARPSENINVFDCKVNSGHGIAMGSEMSGGISNVNIWNINLEFGHGINIKTLAKRGGYVKNVRISNCRVPMIGIGEYGNVDDGTPAPEIARVSNITIEDVTLSGFKVFLVNLDRKEPASAISVKGLGEGNPVKNVSIKNVLLKYRSMLPYQILALENVENVEVENITCLGEM